MSAKLKWDIPEECTVLTLVGQLYIYFHYKDFIVIFCILVTLMTRQVITGCTR